MGRDHETQVISFISGLALGTIIGAGIAILVAPESGRRTRRRIQRAAGDLRETATDRWDELSDDVRGRVGTAIKGARSRL
jgi:gas vesicle protein